MWFVADSFDFSQTEKFEHEFAEEFENYIRNDNVGSAHFRRLLQVVEQEHIELVDIPNALAVSETKINNSTLCFMTSSKFENIFFSIILTLHIVLCSAFGLWFWWIVCYFPHRREVVLSAARLAIHSCNRIRNFQSKNWTTYYMNCAH